MENVVMMQKLKSKRKFFIITALASLLVAAAVSVIVVQSHTNAAAHGGAAVVKSTCAFTLYPELCISTIKAAAPAVSMTSSRDVLITALNYTIYTVGRNYFTVKKIGAARRSHLTGIEKGALRDCLEVIDDTLEELRDSEMC